MKRLALVLTLGFLLLSAGAAWAFCTTTTIWVNGKGMICTTCCVQGLPCTVNCF